MQLYRKHLKSSEDLVTPYETTRAGFVALALEKNRRAAPYLSQARYLQSMAFQAQTPADLLQMKTIESGLLTTAGLSDKALLYLTSEDKTQAIKGLIREFLEPAGPKFVEELVFRFLLIRGDALGGTMRNLGGALAQKKLTEAILSALTLAGIEYRWQDSKTRQWLPMDSDDPDMAGRVRGIHWLRGGDDRTLFYNLTVPLVKNNVDLCLFDLSSEAVTRSRCCAAESYLALGELKGGIDPAGADEHWKTARTALNRVREAFAAAGHAPHTFFVGASIQKRMAGEIWSDLEAGVLSNAANLTNDDQLAAIANWLCEL